MASPLTQLWREMRDFWNRLRGHGTFHLRTTRPVWLILTKDGMTTERGIHAHDVFGTEWAWTRRVSWKVREWDPETNAVYEVLLGGEENVIFGTHISMVCCTQSSQRVEHVRPLWSSGRGQKGRKTRKAE